MVSQVFYYNQAQQYPQIQKDYQDVKQHVEKADDTDKSLVYALEALPPVRRTESIPDKIDKGDYTYAAGLASLAVLNLPEDLRDIKGAYKQLTDKNYKPKYDYKTVQHPFSFFRGTFLHRFVDPNTTKNPELAQKLLKADTTVADTTLGQKILNWLGVHQSDNIKTGIKNIGSTEAKPKFLFAKVYKSNGVFGDLTARAMTRTTKIGLIALAALEIPKILNAMGEGDTVTEKAENTAKQTAKSIANRASITGGIAYGGAIGAKRFGHVGSLVGMGIGSIIGSFASKKLQESVG